MSVIDDIKSRVDLVELVSETVKLRKSGRTFTGLCPFHAHKNNTPSFAVWPESGNWRCFGQCNEGGDAFKFVMKRDGVDFAEALRVLAQRTGVEVKPRTPEEQERDDNLGHLRQLLDTAVTYYHHLLKNAPGAETARTHLSGRGLTAQAIEMFQLGYAPDGWDTALKYFTSKGYAQQDLLDAGLIIVKEEDERVFDRFRDRLMIPVRDERGRITGFQARALKADAIPKFMNSPQTALFDKGRTLFGLDRARKAASRKTSPVDDAERLEQLLEPHESASAPAERNDLHRQLIEALGTLPPDQRAALVLVDMQGYPVAEAARVLDVPTGTVKSRCARGRARLLPLLAHLRPDGGDPDKNPEAGSREGTQGRNRAQGTSVPPAAETHAEGPDGAGTGDSAAVKGGGGRA